MTYNEWHLPMQGEYHDLVELKNVSSAPLLLSDYYLSDSGSERNAYRLPETELAPGELYVLQCSDEFSVGAPFSLNSESEELFLSYKDGTLCDYACLRDLRFGGSYGRRDGENGYFFFDLASPGSQNTGGERSIAEKPAALEKDGVFISTTVGISMYPLLKNRRDNVVLEKPKGRLKKYDVPLYKRDGKYILHRIIKVEENSYVTCGDNCKEKELGILDKDILAVATGFYRKNKFVSVQNPVYKAYSVIWVAIYPLRMLWKKIRPVLGKIKRKMKRILMKK
jgi:hypothetical protein